MIHVICDLCGKECVEPAYFFAITPITKWAINERYVRKPLVSTNDEQTKAWVVCAPCKKQLPFGNHYKERRPESLKYTMTKELLYKIHKAVCIDKTVEACTYNAIDCAMTCGVKSKDECPLGFEFITCECGKCEFCKAKLRVYGDC